MNTLFVGAHPDDIEAFAGGTALRCADRGDKLFFCVATNGNCGSSTLPAAEIAAVRHAEAQAGADNIGAELIWLDVDDEFLFDSRETRVKFINALRIAEADVVVCHWTNDYNPDHSASGKIVDEVVSMMGIPNIKTDAPPCTKIPHVYYMDTIAGVNFDPQIYVDISDVFERKVELVRCHESQASWMVDLFGYELEEFLELPAKWRGLQCRRPLAEAFRPSYRWARQFTEHYLPAG